MNKKTIYSTQSQELLRLFEETVPKLCVYHYAKKDHVVNGFFKVFYAFFLKAANPYVAGITLKGEESDVRINS